MNNNTKNQHHTFCLSVHKTNLGMTEAKRAMYEYHSCTMEPWDGPAMMAFTDGKTIGATLDRNGLRPARYVLTKDNHVMLSSEVGVLSQLKESEVVEKGRLEPGKMFLVDFELGTVVSDDVVKNLEALKRPYQEYIQEQLWTLCDLKKAKAVADVAHSNHPNVSTLSSGR